MRKLGIRGFALALGGLSVGISTGTAHAYLDPGTGSMILQVLLGGVAGLALAGKLYWHKLLSLFGIRREASEPEVLDSQAGVEADTARK
jgi:hypothetical protein